MSQSVNSQQLGSMKESGRPTKPVSEPPDRRGRRPTADVAAEVMGTVAALTRQTARGSPADLSGLNPGVQAAMSSGLLVRHVTSYPASGIG